MRKHPTWPQSHAGEQGPLCLIHGQRDHLHKAVKNTLHCDWEVWDSEVVPGLHHLDFCNEMAKIDAAVLYADLDGSTALVDGYSAQLAAMVYKSFLLCCVEAIHCQLGVVTAYDGDRAMGVFVGPGKESRAVQAALAIGDLVGNAINGARVALNGRAYRIRHVVGVDTSELHVARIGVPGASDLVWIGRAANHAAKLSAVDGAGDVLITGDVRDRIDRSLLNCDRTGLPLWQEKRVPALRDRKVFGPAPMSTASTMQKGATYA